MELKRLTDTELKDICTNIFYSFMSTGGQAAFDGERGKFLDFNNDYPTPMDMLWLESQETMVEDEKRIEIFNQEIQEVKKKIEEEKSKGTLASKSKIKEYEDEIKALEEGKKLLLEEIEHISKSNIEYQKNLEQETGVLDYARSIVCIPLSRKINSFYDDLFVEVAFLDDIGIPNGKYASYKVLSTNEERKQFIKDNTEITHMSICLTNNNKIVARIALQGELNDHYDFSEHVNNKKCVNFAELTLADTIEATRNNDIMQILQTKVDFSKENLKLLTKLDIRGCKYSLYLYTHKDEDYFFIKYECPSTKRIYFNPLNLEYLSYSKYYEEDNYESYLKSWFNVTHLGASCEGKDFNRC